MVSEFYNNAVFWIAVEKIKPNPFQPRQDFDQVGLQSLADSIRQYGILQALVVSRREISQPDGGLSTEYELIAGERRLRAAKMAGLSQVPALIRAAEDNNLAKLELALIENIQREDLNPVDRARAFHRLVNEFKFKHSQVAVKIGKSREYVTNSLRILNLPDYILEGLSQGKISEGHTRPIIMLEDRPAEQETLYKEIVEKKITVREAESIARRIAFERTRKKIADPNLLALEERLSQSLGARVRIEKGQKGGRISIDFFSEDDLQTILGLIEKSRDSVAGLDAAEVQLAGRTAEPAEKEDDLYFIRNFSV